jgi:sugar lactone lactonase YvrE
MKAYLPLVATLGLLLLSACAGGGGSAAGGGGGASAPAISTQPSSVTVADGATASYTVSAVGTAPLAYQWLRNDVNVTGATGATYSFAAQYPADNGVSFTVKVSNGAGSATSSAASLTVTPIAPVITVQPASVSVGDGAFADFTATATGSAPLAYQWQTAQAGSSVFADIIGATGSSSYRLWVAQQGNSGSKFRVVATNDAGSATSSAATLTVNPAAPTIRRQPHDLTVQQGTDATFTVEAGGTAPLHFQWHRGASAVGLDSASFTVSAATVGADNNATFNVMVSNTLGSVQSNTVILHVAPVAVAPTSVTIAPAGTVTVGEGAPVSFVATVDSAATAVNFQWRSNGVDVAGAVGDHFEITQATAPMDGETYSVRASNSASATPVSSTDSTLRVTPGSFTLLAGHVGGVGNVDGTGATAQFNSPVGVALDTAGNAYVADSANHTIRRISSAGVVTTIAGQPGVPGRSDGAGTSAARFNIPRGVAADANGNVYVADQANNAIRRIDIFGNVLTIAGSGTAGSANNATGTLATFNRPVGLALIGTTLYVVDAGNNKIRQIDLNPLGSFAVADLSGTGVAGAANATLTNSSYSNPVGISADAAGLVLYVADSGNAIVRRLDIGADAVTTLAGQVGVTVGLDGNLATASFSSTDALVYSAVAKAVFVADAVSHTIRKVDLAVLSSAAAFVTTLAGNPGNAGVAGGVGTAARFNSPQGIAVTAAGDRLVVSDYASNLVDDVTLSTRLVASLAGSAVARGYVNGKADGSLFNIPKGLAVDTTQKLYIADSANDVIRVIDLARLLTDAGFVSLYAGNHGVAGTTDGALAVAKFNDPTALAFGAGALYVADTGNHSVRKIVGGLVSTVANAGAGLNLPGGVAVDAAGNVYVASTGNHNIYLVAGGTVTLIGGSGAPGLMNGLGAASQFNFPVGLALDDVNHLLYVADRGNCAIRMIDVSNTTYTVSTLAGGAGCGSADGDAATARFALPLQLALDGTATAGQPGGLYVTDLNNHAVRKVTGAGVVSTVVGSPARIGAQLGSSNPASSGLNGPVGVSVDAASGRLFISDANEHAIMRIAPLP